MKKNNSYRVKNAGSQRNLFLKKVTLFSFVLLAVMHGKAQQLNSCTQWDQVNYNGAMVRNNTWGFGAAGAGTQCMVANSPSDWSVTSTHIDPGAGAVKGYPQCIKGWINNGGYTGTNSGLPLQVNNLTASSLYWKMDIPVPGRYMALWDIYLNDNNDPGSGLAKTSLMIFQQIRDATGYYPNKVANLTPVTIGGQSFRYEITTASWARGNVIVMYQTPYNGSNLGVNEATYNLKAIIDYWVSQGKIASNEWLVSVQNGIEIIAGGTYKTVGYASSFTTGSTGGGGGGSTPVGSTKYEAESAVLSGTNLSTSCGGYTGSGFVNGLDANGDRLTFNNVSAPSTGNYNLTIRYSVCNNQQNFIKVNGTNVGGGSTAFNGNNCCGWLERTVTVPLNAGNSNSIVIEKDWGWMNVDFISLNTTATGGGGGGSTPTATTTNVYTDALANDWSNWSWDTNIDFNNSSQVKTGSRSLRANYTSNYGGISLRKGSALPSNNLTEIKFWVYSTSARSLNFSSQSSDNGGNSSTVPFTTNANAWKEITISRSQLGNPTSIKKLTFQANNFTGEVIYDDIRLVSPGTLARGVNAGSQQSVMVIEKSVKIFPNPVKDNTIGISFSGYSLNEPLSISIENIAGKRIFTTVTTAQNFMRLNRTLNPGSYVLSVVSNRDKITRTFNVLK